MAKTSYHIDYYPGGSIMPGRSFSSNSYRFGYNAGSEKDDEIFGTTGSAYHTYFRELDNRINRWWGIDPKTNLTPWQSPYSYMDGNPIWFNDPRGNVVGDYYKTGLDGKVSYSHSDDNKGDGKVYLDGKQLPSYSDRQILKDKIDDHLENGPTFNEIGGRSIPVIEYNINDEPSVPGVSKDVLVDAVPSNPFMPPGQGGVNGGSVSINLNTGAYTSPEGYYHVTKKPNYTWHLHPSGAYVKEGGVWKPILHNKIPLYPNSEIFSSAIGPTLGYDKGRFENSLEFTFEPKNNSVYVIDYFENTSKASFDWFFNVQEGKIK